jgi:hypothetical protein
MSVELDDVFRQNQDTASREIGGLAYVVDPATAELHGFNEVATRVWALLDGARSLGDVVTCIVDEYDIDRHTAEADVLELLEELSAKHLVVLA